MRIKISKEFFRGQFLYTLLLLLGILTCLSALLQSIHAQSGINGLFQNYNAVQTTPAHKVIAARNRLRIQFNRQVANGSLYAENDLVHRYSERAVAELLVREIYIDWYFNKADLRIGKQVISWGRANGAFVTGILSPLDLSEFLTQDPSDLILGTTSLNYTRYYGENSLQFIFSPVFEKNRLPESDSRWFPVQPIDAPLPVSFIQSNNSPSIRDAQLALKYSIRSISSLDLDLMLLHWTHPAPSFALTLNLLDFPNFPSIELTETYQTSPMAGYSLNWQLSNRWSLQSESLFVYNTPFTFLPVSVNRLENALESATEALLVLQEFEIRNDGYLLSKPWLQMMFGVQTELYGITFNLQAYLETIINYEDRILPQRYFPYATALLNRSVLRDRLQLISIGRYNFFGDDFWFQFQGVYEINDGVEFALGTNLFGGNEVSPFYGHFTFYQFRENSFIFSKLSVYF